MPNPQSEFIPSSSQSYAVGSIPAGIVLPPLDGANSALVLKNTGGATLAITGGPTVAPATYWVGSITLTPGASVLVADAALLGGVVATVQAVPQGNTTLTAMRGSASATRSFSAPGVPVI